MRRVLRVAALALLELAIVVGLELLRRMPARPQETIH